MATDKIILILPDRFRAHSIPMMEGLQEEVLRAWMEYGHLTEKEAWEYRDSIEIRFSSDLIEGQPQ